MINKDPAFLFYYQDFLIGTEFMPNEEVGAYIRILAHQADKGHLTEKQVLSICRGYAFTDSLKEKFVLDPEGKYYNVRLDEEMKKRRKFAESRRNNALGLKAYAEHMGDVNENINEIVNKKEDINNVVKIWNDFAEKNKLSKVAKLTDKRTKKLSKRLEDESFNLDNIFTRILESDFLLGKTSSWKVDFDFIIENETNFIKILEGKYTGKTKDGIYAKHITDDKLRRVAEGIANDKDLK